MRDYKNDNEIVKNEEHFISDTNKIKVSLVICCWSTSHLLARSVYTYLQQDFPVDQWELIVVNDNSPDDVRAAIEPLLGKINVRYIKLEHTYGIRGNTKSFNVGFTWANGEILMESTPEIMFQKTTISDMYTPHLTNERCFVATKTYNLGQNDQLLIDTIDWKSDVNNIKILPEFNSAWTQNNVSNTNFGTHQSCSIRKAVFYEITKGFGFPLYGGYGEDDPYFHGTRRVNRVKDITIMEPMVFHQWHLSFQFFASMGYAPMLNKWNHSMSNYMSDESGEVPEGGTCMIWDKGSHELIGDEEKKAWKGMDDWFIRTGGLPSIIKPRVLSDGTIV